MNKEKLIDYIKIKVDEKFSKVLVTPYQQQRLRCMSEIIEIIEKYEESPLTLADLLGWEEEKEYICKDENVKFKIKDKCLYHNFYENCWERLSILLSDKVIKELQRAKKVEPKLKAYHVKDEYSYNCLMKELEERGYTSLMGTKPTNLGFWENHKQKTVIYCDKYKSITYGHLSYYETDEKDNYDLIEYYKEEPKFYAKIKGWELYHAPARCYWHYDNILNDFYLSVKDNWMYSNGMTKTDWNKLGINDTNADFEEVEE